VADAGPVLARELEYAYDYLREARLVDTLPKLKYIIRYIEVDMLDADSGTSLAQQLNSHIQDLCTMKEADLCGSVSMPERVFVSTVHKAKGLEFDHVVVYDAVEGKYPSVYANTRGGDMEEARKFYVAISRARKRLIISYCRQMITRWGKQYPKKLSPYVDTIRSYFM
jgi:DNA helicase-2/ATP-dependent DNA helicase PcrA